MYINEGQGEGPSVSRTDPTRLTTWLPITSTVFDRQGCQKREKPQTDRKPWVIGNRVVTICYSFLCLIRNETRLDIDTSTDTIISFPIRVSVTYWKISVIVRVSIIVSLPYRLEHIHYSWLIAIYIHYLRVILGLF